MHALAQWRNVDAVRMRATIKIMAAHSQQKNHVTRNLVIYIDRWIMILRLPKSDLRMRGGNAGRLSTEISAPVAGRLSTSSLLRETSFWGNGFLCRLRMYHYGWLCEELTHISEMYADAMDVNHCNSAKNSSPEIPFLRLRWRQRSPRTLS